MTNSYAAPFGNYPNAEEVRFHLRHVYLNIASSWLLCIQGRISTYAISTLPFDNRCHVNATTPGTNTGMKVDVKVRNRLGDKSLSDPIRPYNSNGLREKHNMLNLAIIDAFLPGSVVRTYCSQLIEVRV